ncbi:MAG: START domain protein [Bacteroidetes bacterium ADurb.Bin408]|nr:MAG: START domain protein [Bacteroidetes bacterium ADurb.Bin408]
MKTTVPLFLFLQFFSFICYGQSQWKVALEKDAVRVWTREVSDSKFKEYKGEILVKSTLSCLVAVLDDVDNQKNWLYDCEESKRLKIISKTEGINYFVQKAPWPVSYRDIVVQYALTQDENTKTVFVEMTGKKDYIPEKKDYVRVPYFKGYWEFTPISNGIIKVVYQAHSETGGSVPAAIANAACVDIPFNTLKNLKKEIEKPKYKNAIIEGLKEY